MITMRKIKEEYLIALGSDRQWLITFRHNVPIILNSISQEEFAIFLIPETTSHKKLKEYKVRQLYNLPHTPRIILLPNQKNERDAHLLLGQKAPFNFQKLLSQQKDIKEVTHLFLKIISITEMLIKKYGYFRLTQKMIKAVQGFILIVWFNENQIENVPQFPYNVHMSTLNEECIIQLNNEIIQQIICLFQKYSNCEMWDRLKNHQKLNFNSVDQSIHQAMTETTKYIRRMSQVPKRLPLDENRQKHTNMPNFLKNKKSENNHSKDIQQKQSICHQESKREQSNLFHKKCATQQVYHKFLNPNNNQTYFTPTQKKGIADDYVPDSKNKLVFIKQRRDRGGDSIYFNVFRPNEKDQSINQEIKTTGHFGDTRSSHKLKISNETTNIKGQHLELKPKLTEVIPRKYPEVNFKDSGFSMSTTAQYLSINSSSNRYYKKSHDLIIHKFTGCKPKLVSTFGTRAKKTESFHKKLKQSQKLGQKVSKIIEESSQNFKSNPHSPVIIQNRLSPEILQTPGSEFEQEVLNLFNSRVREEKSDQIESIEDELSKLMSI